MDIKHDCVVEQPLFGKDGYIVTFPGAATGLLPGLKVSTVRDYSKDLTGDGASLQGLERFHDDVRREIGDLVQEVPNPTLEQVSQRLTERGYIVQPYEPMDQIEKVNQPSPDRFKINLFNPDAIIWFNPNMGLKGLLAQFSGVDYEELLAQYDLPNSDRTIRKIKE